MSIREKITKYLQSLILPIVQEEMRRLDANRMTDRYREEYYLSKFMKDMQKKYGPLPEGEYTHMSVGNPLKDRV